MKKRAVAYCRVSSDHEDQRSSLENQKKMWLEYIDKNKELKFCGLYIDEGLSGTSIKNRKGFNDMIHDALLGKFDIILTKEVSRFARNTVDTLRFTRELKKYNVDVYFKIDNINTGDNDGELRLSLMATLAQEESRKISERVKVGQEQAMKNGVVFGANRILGYDLVDKKLIVNEKEAEIVKKIYDWYLLDDCSLHNIVKKLADIGINRGKMGGKLNHSSIRRILQNEKYKGELKQKKYYTQDYLTHVRKKNNGEMKYITIKENHIPIINKEIWESVQKKINNNKENYIKKGIGKSKSLFSGVVYCASCKKRYRKKTMRNKDREMVVYKCSNNHSNGKKACMNGTYIKEELLKKQFIRKLKSIYNKQAKKVFVSNIEKVLRDSLDEDCNISKLEKQNKLLNKLLDNKNRLLELYIDGQLDKKVYNKKNNDIINLEKLIREEINKNNKMTPFNNELRIDNITKLAMKELDYEHIGENDMKFFIDEYIEKIVINKKNKVKIFLKA
ncbi:recombinase family protein [Clostridiaceae bacterium M8S5]|nr:recombinase family protein [Clostridiaceae bacterium M8S5]